MGLFEKKLCAICGKKKGLFGAKLKDGNYLCFDCLSKMSFSPVLGSGIELNLKAKPSELTLDEFNEYVELRQSNLEELQDFNCTKSLCGNIQIDEDAQEIIFVDNATFSNKERLYEQNPPIFKVENLALARITLSEIETGTTITGKAKAECKVYLVVGFEDPVYDVSRIEIGKRKAKEGFLSDKVTESPDIEVLTKTIASMLDWEISICEGEDVVTPAASMDSFWRMVNRAKSRGYMSSDEIRECLKNYYGRDKAAIREIRKTYDL